MPTVLIIGATRGLGAELAKHYAAQDSNTVYGTARSPSPPSDPLDPRINWIPNIDISTEPATSTLLSALSTTNLDLVILSAGYFGAESFSEPSWTAQLRMYTTSAMAPVFFVSGLFHAGNLIPHATKVVSDLMEE